MVDIYNGDKRASQEVYDHFNGFIFSGDRAIFNKLKARIDFHEHTKHLFGDIVECGVFKGSGMATWLKILASAEPNSNKKVIGFDVFDPDFFNNNQTDLDAQGMKRVLARSQDEVDLEEWSVRLRLINAGFDDSKFELVRGDICDTAFQYPRDKPGFRISILYLDLDIYEPTMMALENFWDRMEHGGIVVFDEYAYHQWSETDAADEFCQTNNLKLQKTGIKAPTAFIVKP